VKKFILIFILTLLIPINVKAVETYDRTTLDNYGVNKKWNITSSNVNNVLNTYKVNSNEKIYDFSNVLTDEEESLLREMINEFIEKHNTDLVIFIDDLNKYSELDNENYAVDFYDYNDFGLNFDRYSGILLWRNASDIPNYKYYDIYTFGDAQLYFNQYRYDDILDTIYNDISSGNYLIGFSKFINMVDDYYDKGIPSNMKGYKVNENGYLYEVYTIPWTPVLIISAIVTIIIMVILIKKNKMVSKVIHANDYLDKHSINYRNRKDNFITSHTRSYTTSSSSGGSSGGFSSRGGSSGGGHSRGGGRRG